MLAALVVVAGGCSLGFSRCLGTQLQVFTSPLILRGLMVCIAFSYNAVKLKFSDGSIAIL